jgi:pyridoxal phosphate enzyme (YggS family)
VTHITDHLADIERRIAIALQRCGRSGESVTTVAVSKMQSADAVRSAAAAGIVHFGENYLQEALEKIAAVANPALAWHFVGRIQSNKTRPLAENFSWVDTLDRARIADRLDAQRPESGGPLNVLIQVNLDNEPQKAGVGEGELLALAQHIARLPRLRLRGLMSIPPEDQTEAARRASFLAVHAAASRLRAAGIPIDTLSFGMSADFELAIACGATCVRIGTALFGERPSAPR